MNQLQKCGLLTTSRLSDHAYKHLDVQLFLCPQCDMVGFSVLGLEFLAPKTFHCKFYVKVSLLLSIVDVNKKKMQFKFKKGLEKIKLK